MLIHPLSAVAAGKPLNRCGTNKKRTILPAFPAGYRSMKTYGIVALLLTAAFVLGSGCVDAVVRDSVSGDLHAHYAYKDDLSVGLGCYERASGYAYNSGNVSRETVGLSLTLVDTTTGSIRDAKTLYIGALKPGESRTFDTTLDGDCSGHYRTDAEFLPASAYPVTLP
jgi:hypothetical protein